MTPGIYNDVPFAEYRSWPALNLSTLMWGRESMEHLRAAIDGRLVTEDSADKRFGRACHARLLEGESVYRERCLFARPCQAILKSGVNKGRACGATASYLAAHGDWPAGVEGWLCGKHAPEGLASPDDFVSETEAVQIDAIAAKVKSHPVVALLKQQGGCEVSISWEAEGVALKSRLDKLVLHPTGSFPPFIADIKKVRVGHAGPDKFAKSILTYGYDMKAAGYIDAVQHACQTTPNFAFIAIEDSEPYSIGVYWLGKRSLDIGRHEYKRILRDYQACLVSGVWPGASTDISEIELPHWKLNEYEGVV